MAQIKICLDAGHYGKYNRSPANKAYYESDIIAYMRTSLIGSGEDFIINIGDDIT